MYFQYIFMLCQLEVECTKYVMSIRGQIHQYMSCQLQFKCMKYVMSIRGYVWNMKYDMVGMHSYTSLSLMLVW